MQISFEFRKNICIKIYYSWKIFLFSLFSKQLYCKKKLHKKTWKILFRSSFIRFQDKCFYLTFQNKRFFWKSFLSIISCLSHVQFITLKLFGSSHQFRSKLDIIVPLNIKKILPEFPELLLVKKYFWTVLITKFWQSWTIISNNHAFILFY